MKRWMAAAMAIGLSLAGTVWADKALDLSDTFDLDGVESEGEMAAGFDRDGRSFRAEEFLKGGKVSASLGEEKPVRFWMPKMGKGSKNVMRCKGQRVVAPKGNFNVLYVLGASTEGDAVGEVTFLLDDDKSVSAFLGLSDWCATNPQYKETAVFTGTQRVRHGEGETMAVKVWGQNVPFGPEEGVAVRAIVFPREHRMKIFAATLSLRDALATEDLMDRGPSDPDEAKVAIFSAPGFPFYGANFMLSPSRLEKSLEAQGISASLIGLKALKDPETFTPQKFPVFLHLYGNTFPQAAIDSLKAYRESGGSCVWTGVPLTHPVMPLPGGGWRDTGHTDRLREALKTGGFGESPNDCLAKGPLAESLGLHIVNWEAYQPLNRQILDVNSLDQGATIETIATLGGEAYPYAALIRHKEAPLSDCTEVWTGSGAYGETVMEQPTRLQEEVIVRSVAFLLNALGRIDEDAASLLYARKDGITGVPKSPDPVFLGAHREPVIPRSPAPSKKMRIFSVQKLADDEILLFTTLQGLMNGEGAPELYLLHNDLDMVWLEEMKKRGDVDGWVEAGREELLAEARKRKVILYDEDLYGSLNVATTLAGILGHPVCSRGLAETLNLDCALDLRGKWDSAAEAYLWLFDEYEGEICKEAVAIYCPLPRFVPLRDYLVAKKVFTFWISGDKEAHIQGVSASAELAVLSRIMSKLPVNIICYGYPWAGHGVGIGEGGGVTFLSRYGKWLVPTDWKTNLTVLTGTKMREEGYQQPPARELVLDESKIYASLLMSDGDNLNTFVDFFLRFWQHEEHGEVPVGWSMGPSIVEMMPPLADYYLDHMKPLDSIGTAVSGVGYVYLDHYGRGFGEKRSAVVEEFVALTDRYRRRLDQDWIWAMRYGEPKGEGLNYYIRGMEGLASIMPDYGKIPGMTPETASYVLDGVPVFHAVAGGSPDRVKQGLQEAAASGVRPLFMHCFMMNWDWKPEDLLRVVQEAPADVVFVRPDELGYLFRQRGE